ncbi:MAG: hypothetical protein ACKV2V_05855 [Blastocatellia bacterium]
MLFVICFQACGKPPAPPPDARAQARAVRDKMKSCLPVAETAPPYKLAATAIRREGEQTRLHIVAWNPADKGPGARAIDFDAPNYLMSYGRWLINEKDRVYLVDQYCREFLLRERELMNRQKEARNGRVKLDPGEAVELQLSFAPLPDNIEQLALVYGATVLPLSAMSLLEVTR